MSPDQIAAICEKAAGIIREKGKADSELWPTSTDIEHYTGGPVCAIGALSIACETHQGEHDYHNYEDLVPERVFDAVADHIEYGKDYWTGVDKIYNYSDRKDTSAENIAEMFERAAKSVTDG